MMADYSDIIQAAAKQYNVDPALIRGVIATESGGNPKAKSGVGATGLMQIMPSNYKALGITDATDPQQNIFGGAKLLSQLLDTSPDVVTALRRYHGGDDQSKWGPVNAAYAGKVLGAAGVVAPQKQQNSVLPGIPVSKSADGQSDDAIFSAFSGGGAPAANAQGPQSDDAIFAAFNKPTQTAQSQSQVNPNASPAQTSAGGDFFSALGHHLMNAPHGLAQMIENGINSGIQSIAPNTALASYSQGVVNQDNAAMNARETNYQKSTPNSIPAYAGATIGEIAPALFAGGGNLIKKWAALGESLGSRLGLQGGAATLAKGTGAAAGSAALGGAYAAAQPVFNSSPKLSDLITGGSPADYWGEKLKQIEGGAILGAAMPGVTSMLGKSAGYIGNTIGSIVRPFTEGGRQQIAADIVSQAAKGGPTAVKSAQLVEGSSPTLAEATANPGIATLQRTIRDLNPSPFVEREQQNAEARLSALKNITGSAEDLANARIARSSDAADNYLSTNVGIPTSDTDYAALKKTPAFQKAFSDAQTMAKNARVPSIETVVQPRANAGLWGVQDKPQTYVSGRGLQWIKQSLDDQIDSAMRGGESGKAANIIGVKDQLLNIMDNNIDGYAAARAQFSQQSKPIDAMQYLQGLNLKDAQGNITLAKVQSALNQLSKQQQKPGINTAKSVTDAQIGALQDIRDDLLRASNQGLGRSAGSSTAQNLATQQMVRTALPGKLGALAAQLPSGSIGAALGGVAGYGAAGPMGSAVGATIGGKVGAGLSALMNTHNEAIQNEVARLLLNPSAGGAALNRATSSSLPFLPASGLQRLMNPSIVTLGSGALSRSTNRGQE